MMPEVTRRAPFVKRRMVLSEGTGLACRSRACQARRRRRGHSRKPHRNRQRPNTVSTIKRIDGHRDSITRIGARDSRSSSTAMAGASAE